MHESFAWVRLWQIEVILTNYFSFFGPSGMQKYKQQILLYKKVMNLPFSSLFSFAFLFPRKCIDSNLFYVWYNVFIIINHKWSVIQIKPIKDLFGGGRYHWNDWDWDWDWNPLPDISAREHLFPAELYFETCNKSFSYFILLIIRYGTNLPLDCL